MPIVSTSEWDNFLENYPNTHILQTSAWGDLKAGSGWTVARIVNQGCGAQVLLRALPLGLHIAYLPKGPVGELESCSSLWKEIDTFCEKHQAVLIKVEPDSWRTPNKNETNLTPDGFRDSPHSIQPSRTIVVDLKGDENSILARMKQKTRYNIRLASKKGVVVRESANVELFHQLVIETSERDQFGVHTLEYYHSAYSLFHARGECKIFMAEYDGQPLAGIMAFQHGERAWYFYGASSNRHRELMPNYLLQWEAMRWARDQGCSEYDLWGVPDENQEALEDQFMTRSDGLWGVYRFKRGFGGEVRRSQGPWDKVYKPILYKVYEWRVSKIGE